MKFKAIFILFNAVILISFLVIYFMPLIMLGWDYTRVFWEKNWGLPVLFVAIIGLLNGYFVMNWKLFHLLEREDWPELILFLEEKVYSKKLVFRQQVRILINAYLVQSNLDAIGKLESYLKREKENMIPRFALAFGVPYLLRNNGEEMTEYFSRFLEIKSKDRYWIRWNYGFAFILQGEREKAEAALLRAAGQKREPVLSLLTFCLLDSLKPEDRETNAVVANGITELRKRFSPATWTREVEKSKNNIQVVILSRLVEEATDWLFAIEESPQGKSDSESTVH